MGRIHELKTESLGKDRLLVLIAIKATESKLNNNPQLVYYFADQQNRIWSHHQIVKSSTCDWEIRKFFVSLGHNMVKYSPMDLYTDWFKKEPEIVFKPFGRCYYGKIVKRRMQWQQDTFEGGVKKTKTVKKTFFDVDWLSDNCLSQEKAREVLGDVYKWWCLDSDAKQNEDVIDREGAEMIFGFTPTWRLKEEQVLGTL